MAMDESVRVELEPVSDVVNGQDDYHREGNANAQIFLSNRLCDMQDPMTMCETQGLAYILALMASAIRH